MKKWAKGAQNELFFKSAYYIFIQFYLMTDINKWAKAIVLDFEEKIKLPSN